MSRYSIFLGDNPFFGVNHLSQEIARKKAAQSQSFENIASVMKYSSGMGVNKMVISTHPQIPDLMAHLSANSDLLKRFEFYTILPYAQGYVSKVNESGLMNTLQEVLKSASLKNKIKILAKGGLASIQNDFFKLFQTLIDIEMTKMGGAKVNTIFIHDAITDLALGLNLREMFVTFSDYVRDSYHANVGIVTKNFALLNSRLNEWDVKTSYIMTSFNPIGFQMNPDRQKCEEALESCRAEVIAMSVLAGGYLTLDDAYKYISGLPKIKNLVFGVSTTEHVQKTFEKFLQSQT